MRLEFAASPRTFLQTILFLRVAAVVGEAVTIFVVYSWLQVILPLVPMAATVAALAVLAALGAARLRIAWPVTHMEVTLQLFIDIAALTILLYCSGGTTNPFAPLYLIPVALAAVGLDVAYVLAVTAVCLGCYLWLMRHFVPLDFVDETVKGAFSLHVIGMAVNFVFSAALLAVAVTALSQKARRREREIAGMREETLRRDHVNAMGMLAASAAHELSTPLFSISLLVSELRSAKHTDRQFTEDLDLLARQVQVCKDKLTTLLEAAGQPRSTALHVVTLQDVLRKILDDWRVVRPEVQLEVDWQGCTGSPLLQIDEGFNHALTSLLNNAADASITAGSNRVAVSIANTNHGVRICIDDEGQGLSESAQQRAGKTVFSTKTHGSGLGLVLSHANLDRLGGELTLVKRPEGGTRTVLEMPAEPQPTRK